MEEPAAPETARHERADSAANHERILAAARDVFARRGLDAEIKEIADRAGVGVGTLYRHFDSRDGLLRALILQTHDDLLQRLRAAADTQDAAHALRAVIHAATDVYRQFGALTEVALAGRLDHLRPDGHEELTAAFTGLLRRGVADGTFRADLDIPMMIAALESVFTSGKVVRLVAERGYAGAAAAISDLFLHACLAVPTGPGRGRAT